MSKAATAQKGKSETKVNQALVEKFIKEHQGKLLIEQNPPPPASGPVTYVIAGVHESKTMGLRADNGGGKFGMILIKQQGDEASEPKTLNPNLVMDLLAGREAKGFELGTGTAAVTTTTEGGEVKAGAEAGDAKKDTTAEDAAKAQAAADKKEAADKKKAEKEAKAKARADEKAAKDARELAEKNARESKKAEKAKNSGKFKALRIYRGEPLTIAAGTTHRSRVMAKFRAPESEGGLGMSSQHANTYYQNCKGQWAKDALPEDQQATAGETAAAQ